MLGVPRSLSSGDTGVQPSHVSAFLVSIQTSEKRRASLALKAYSYLGDLTQSCSFLHHPCAFQGLS